MERDMARELALLQIRGTLWKLRRLLADLKSYPAADAVAHAVKILDQSMKRGGQSLMDRQAKAVIREWREALEDGAFDLARRIELANPDLFLLSAEIALHYADHGGEG